ncbi:DUF427 domain-containing protein [Microlunatus sp. Gsoil 973]|uniref:DUF427 domain-containing protein n=1 Tax=Microlunatus sp. Gsoil 973 TaxID=2672569 RepID=UPI0012B47C1E|nr:DUF427 domain-containing protein [Microlunatus sp. Gsoil 973]QGN33223.1 DUF427 domain-containing protein [Microlunatus sp. Gsoil 973]
MKSTIRETEVAVAYADEVICIEGNSYFPPSAVNLDLLKESDTLYVCPWKGRAQYYDVIIDGIPHHDAAWAYPHPKSSAVRLVGQDFASYVAFDPAQVLVGRVQEPASEQA